MPEPKTFGERSAESCRKCRSIILDPNCPECREIRDLSLSMGVVLMAGEMKALPRKIDER